MDYYLVSCAHILTKVQLLITLIYSVVGAGACHDMHVEDRGKLQSEHSLCTLLWQGLLFVLLHCVLQASCPTSF